jgi:hypothetical protein
MPVTLRTFEAGQRYGLTFIGDSDLHVIYQVLHRTPKFITVTDGHETVRVAVKPDQNGEEIAYPMGRYALAPILGANDNGRLFNGKLPDELPLGPIRTGIGV